MVPRADTLLGMNGRRRLIAAALVAATFASAIGMACSEGTAGPPARTEAGAPDTSAPDARRVPPDAEDVSCEAGDASGADPPAPYTGRTNPLASSAGAVNAGRETFAVRCAFCHGPGGKGDGPEGPRDPPPANLTAVRRADDYLLWRISEGGRSAPFCSAMPGFGTILTELQRWQLIALIDTLAPPVADGGRDAAGE